MTDDEVMKVASDILKLKPNIVCICGGEPLVRKELVYRVAELLTSGSNGQISVNMVTNGELLTEEVAQKLKKAGLKNVQVSLDGHEAKYNDWLRNKVGAFGAAINAIKMFKKQEMLVSVASTTTTKTLKHYKKTMELCRSIGVDIFRMQPLMLLGRAEKNLKDYVSTYSDYREVVTYINHQKKINIGTDEMKTEWGDPIDHLVRASAKENKYTSYLGVNAYGDITISPYIPLIFGNVANRSLLDYWDSGLNKCWSIPLLRELASLPKSCEELDLTEHNKNLPKMYSDGFINLDLMKIKDFQQVTLQNIHNYVGSE